MGNLACRKKSRLKWTNQYFTALAVVSSLCTPRQLLALCASGGEVKGEEGIDKWDLTANEVSSRKSRNYLVAERTEATEQSLNFSSAELPCASRNGSKGYD